MKTILFVVVAVDAFGAATVLARLRDRLPAAVAGLTITTTLLATACTAGPAVLDGLDISAEAAQIAAGVLLLVPGFALAATGDQLFLAGEREGGWRDGVVPLAVPLLAGPAPIAVVAALADRRGRGDVALALTIAIVVSGLALAVAARRPRGRRSVVEGVAGRSVGAAMVLVAFALIVDGVLGV